MITPDPEVHLKEPTPQTPTVSVPRIDQLSRRVHLRMWIRRGATGVSLGLVLLLGLVASAWLSDVNPRTSRPLVEHDVENRHSDVTSDSMNSNDQPSIDPGSDVHVYALVRDRVPVFGVPHGSDQVQFVGWIESEQTLPVELNRFPTEQQQNIKSVLYREDDSNNLISL